MSKNTSDYKDKYFTKSSVISHHLNAISTFLDKSAPIFLFDFSGGNGVLVKTQTFATSILQIDIDPMSPSVSKIDWLSAEGKQKFEEFYKNCKECGGQMIVGYNPPFGRGGSMFKKFILQLNNFADLIFIIGPVLDWRPDNYKLCYSEFLPQKSFYIPDTNADYDVSAEFAIYEKSMGFKFQALKDIKISDTGKLEAWWNVSHTPKNRVFLLIRKVGAYAGRQFYYFDTSSDNVSKVRVFYYNGDGTSTDYGWTIVTSFDSNTPWAKNGHIVCENDPSSSYKGSNPRYKKKPRQRKRQGTGFLKVSTDVDDKFRLTFIQFKELCKQFDSFISTNNLNTGSPKSISRNICARFFNK